MLKSYMKTTFITLFDVKGTVHFGFIPQGQIVNQAYYVEILKWLCEPVPELWPQFLDSLP